MGTLLVVLVVACALASAVHLGRGFWARSRSVERHRQALDTLADITNAADAPLPNRAAPPDHQAHVRLIGPEGHVEPDAGLPPPRPFSRSKPANNPTPMRRPSRTAPSAAAIDAVTASAAFGRDAGAKLVRTRPQRQASALASPGAPGSPGGPGNAPGADDATRPLFLPPVPPPPPSAGEPPTRPVPVIRPQVFYFDDLTSRSGSGSTGLARRGRLRGKGPRDNAGAGSAEGPVGWPGGTAGSEDAGPLPTAERDRPGGQPVLGRLLAAAAAVVALAAAGTAVVIAEGQRHKPQPSAAATPTTTAQRTAPSTSQATGAPHTTTTTAPPKKAAQRKAKSPVTTPAVLVRPSKGTDEYQLTSAPDSIVIMATGPCWIEVRAGSPLGQVITETTMKKGQVETVTGPAWVRLGDPVFVEVTVNGVRLRVPGASVAVPLNLDFTLG